MIKYSIVIPHLSNSRCIETCLKYIKENSLYEHEIIQIVDEYDVYHAFNKGVFQSSCDIVVLLNDDMMVAKHWDKYIPIYSKQDTILTGYVIERNTGPVIDNRSNCIKYDCGSNPNDFDYEKFEKFSKNAGVKDIEFNVKGWYMPLVVNKKTFVTYPNIQKFPAANDITLIDKILPENGYKFALIDMFVYHFQNQATIDLNMIKKRCIFSYCNHQIDEKIPYLQAKVIEKFNDIPNCRYEFLKYQAKDGEVFPNQVIEYAFNTLFYEKNYDTILMLDIDCVPLSKEAILNAFEKAENGILYGNVQRSNHIQNNQHCYVAPSAMCITKEMYEKLGKPTFSPTSRGDIGEELTYVAEEKNIPIEMLMPHSYEKLPYDSNSPWDLAEGMPKYGIGTTFADKDKNPQFYHLFQSRVGVFNDLFFLKCADIILK